MSETKKVPTIVEDERPITSVFCGPSGNNFTVGTENITAIIAYNECGEYAHVPWVAIYRGEEIAYRYPAHQLAIGYEDPHQMPF